MSLDTYDGLKTAIADFLNRTDLTSAIPTFISLAEAQMNRRLKTRRMVGRSDATLSDEFVSVPDDFGGVITIKLTGTSPEAMLDFVDPIKAAELLQTTYTAAGQPRFYSVVGEGLQLIPAPDAPYTAEMTYWKRIEPLSDDNDSNWILADHPDAYLYGSLLQSAPYLSDDPRLVVWGQIFTTILSDIESDDTFAQYGGRLNMRAKSFG